MASKKRTGTAVKVFWRLVFFGFGSFILLILLANWGVFGKMPSIQDLENPSASLASEVIADDGTVMGKYILKTELMLILKILIKILLMHSLLLRTSVFTVIVALTDGHWQEQL